MSAGGVAAHPGEPRLVLVRHGATEWSQNGRHTSRTDLPLLPSGIDRARALGPALAGFEFAQVLSSPLQRARQTAELAGYGERLEIAPELTEWDYGDYEGLTSEAIWKQRPDWKLWTDGAPGGESPQQVAARADGVIASVAQAGGDVLLFAHGHILRVLAARWIGEPPALGALLKLDPATISILGHEHDARVIERWNGPAS
ncbi:MAG: histidine phosphatase family protein [Acidobacteriota bacterium]|nr:histidine phosphatase family protein [Acidobacteriota bacterium]